MDLRALLESFTEGEHLGELEWLDKNITKGDFTFLDIVHRWGGEGCGDSIGYVAKFRDNKKDETLLIKVDGYYDSWNGLDYNDAEIKIVKPVVKSVVFYE